MIRRTLSAGALVACVALMTACGGSTATSTTTDPAPAEPSAEAEASTPAPTSTPAPPPADQWFTPVEDRDVYTGDLAAKSDASYLWMVMATWFVDNDGAPPTITAEDGRYLFDGVDVGWVTPGVDLGGQTGAGFDDWCVWVTAPGGTVKDFHVTAAGGGVEPGPC